ncbi:hypothetical protein ACFQ7G_19430 [Streptomyces massasporeus]
MNLHTMAAATPGVHGGTVLGHDFNAWTVAMICAIVAAVVYEVTMALTRAVTLRIPFLVLQIARLQLSRAYRPGVYPMWRSELWAILRDSKTGRLRRFFQGFRYASGLALFGARATMKAKIEVEGKAKVEPESKASTEKKITRARHNRRRAGFELAIMISATVASFWRNVDEYWDVISRPSFFVIAGVVLAIGVVVALMRPLFRKKPTK